MDIQLNFQQHTRIIVLEAKFELLRSGTQAKSYRSSFINFMHTFIMAYNKNGIIAYIIGTCRIAIKII